MTGVVAVLHSGGVDSTLAALLLDRFYDVTLVTATFGVTASHEHARESAAAVSLPSVTVDLDRSVAEAAVDRMVADGYPRAGIQRVHEHAVETVAADAADLLADEESGEAGADEHGFGAVDRAAVADGTRRDDRVPSIDRSLAQSVEDRHGVDYLRPLAGIGRGAIDAMAERALRVETGPSEAVPTGDYEADLRALLADEHGSGAVESVFPEHTQSRVVGLADGWAAGRA